MKPNEHWIVPALLLLQTLFVGLTFESLLVLGGLYAACAAIAYSRTAKAKSPYRSHDSSLGHSVDVEQRGLRKSLRSRLGLALLLLVAFVLSTLWRLQEYIGLTFNPVAFTVDAVAHVSLVSALILFCFHPRAGHPSMLGLGMLVVMMSVAAGGSSQSLTGQITVALLTTVCFLIASRYILRSWSTLGRGISSTLATDPSTRRARNENLSSRRFETDNGRIGLLFSVLTLSMILMATSAIAHVTSNFLPDLQGIVHDQLQSSLDAVTPNIRAAANRYVTGSRLGSLRRHMLSDPTEIALVAHAQSQPGYLRGSAFDSYVAGQWLEYEGNDYDGPGIESFEPRVLQPSGYATTNIQGISGRKLSRFNLHDNVDDKLATVEIHNDPEKGQVYFTPLSTRWVEASARRIRINNHDVIEYGIRMGAPYIAGVARTPRSEVLDPSRRNILLQVSPGTSAVTNELSDQLCGKYRSTHAKAAAIQNYFQNEYEYSLRGTPVPPRVDPLVYFLEIKHPGHCEYFATATVQLLRSAGIPARYVTGYVVSEHVPEEDHWVARNRDAHAWAEAYDDASQSWFPVESTPGRSYSTLLTNGANAASLAQALDDSDATGRDNDSLLSRLWGWATSMRATDPLVIVFQFLQLPLFLMVAFLLWKRFWRGDDRIGSPADLKSYRMLASVDRRLRKHAMVRAPHETLHQFADRLELHSQSLSTQSISTGESTLTDSVGPLLTKYAAWYRRFAEARYCGKLPEPYAAR